MSEQTPNDAPLSADDLDQATGGARSGFPGENSSPDFPEEPPDILDEMQGHHHK